MDVHQNRLQFLGFFGIIKESAKIIFKRRNIFSNIAFFLILPLSFIDLTHAQISQQFLYFKLSRLGTREWVSIFLIFELTCSVFLMILSLLFNSTVVHTIALIYAGRDMMISFKKVMSIAMHRAWKRLIVTFLCNSALFLVFNLIFGGTLFFAMPFIGALGTILLTVIYILGLNYISLVQQVACVVSFLEDLRGIRALIKSVRLTKHKTGISLSLCLILTICSAGVSQMFRRLVVAPSGGGLGFRIGFGAIWLLLLVAVKIFGLVVETVIYFVCKSFRNEHIEKLPSSADNLDSYLRDYVPLKSEVPV